MDDDFVTRARAFLDAEAKRLDKERKLDPEMAARMRLLISWTGQLLRHEASLGKMDPFDLEEIIEDFEYELSEMRRAADEALLSVED
jgi:hypothetical protein